MAYRAAYSTGVEYIQAMRKTGNVEAPNADEHIRCRCESGSGGYMWLDLLRKGPTSTKYIQAEYHMKT
jgi:hypothetical protein